MLTMARRAIAASNHRLTFSRSSRLVPRGESSPRIPASGTWFNVREQHEHQQKASMDDGRIAIREDCHYHHRQKQQQQELLLLLDPLNLSSFHVCDDEKDRASPPPPNRTSLLPQHSVSRCLPSQSPSSMSMCTTQPMGQTSVQPDQLDSPFTATATSTTRVHTSKNRALFPSAPLPHLLPFQYQQVGTQVRSYHVTTRSERSAVAIVLGLGALSATAYAASAAVSAYREWQDSQPPPPPSTPETPKEPSSSSASSSSNSSDNTDTSSFSSTSGATDKQSKSSTDKNTGNTTGNTTGTSKNFFTEWFGVNVGAKYYEGGFDDVMTRREAALILGVRESSPPSRIRDAHRKLLILNHPDAGGSTYMAGKINQAKELLLKGRRDRNE
jgi:DnaJ homolog subfamily C member 19